MVNDVTPRTTRARRPQTQSPPCRAHSSWRRSPGVLPGSSAADTDPLLISPRSRRVAILPLPSNPCLPVCDVDVGKLQDKDDRSRSAEWPIALCLDGSVNLLVQVRYRCGATSAYFTTRLGDRKPLIISQFAALVGISLKTFKLAAMGPNGDRRRAKKSVIIKRFHQALLYPLRGTSAAQCLPSDKYDRQLGDRR
jgi:hypothetical protein